MDELNLAFNDYISSFKNLSINEKKNEIIHSLKEFIVIIDYLASSDNITLNYLKSNEIKDLFNDNVSEDDYLEAVLVYIEVVKNLVGEYLEKR